MWRLFGLLCFIYIFKVRKSRESNSEGNLHHPGLLVSCPSAFISCVLTVPILCLTCCLSSGFSLSCGFFWIGSLLSQSYKKAIDEVSITFSWSYFHRCKLKTDFVMLAYRKVANWITDLLSSLFRGDPLGGEPLQESSAWDPLTPLESSRDLLGFQSGSRWALVPCHGKVFIPLSSDSKAWALNLHLPALLGMADFLLTKKRDIFLGHSKFIACNLWTSTYGVLLG